MHLCHRHTVTMEGNLILEGRGIGEEQVAASAPMVRALVVQRLEMIWRSCEGFINLDEGKPDPRFVEAGIRVLDRLARLYRLDNPERADNEPDAVSLVDVRELAAAQVAELEAKLRAAG